MRNPGNRKVFVLGIKVFILVFVVGQNMYLALAQQSKKLPVIAQTITNTATPVITTTPVITATPTSPSAQPQVVGGVEAEPGAWPWMAALVSANEPNAFKGQFCGGSLVRPDWILTAAHCFIDEETGKQIAFSADVEVVLGRHRLSSTEGERIAVNKIIVHPNYDYKTKDFDIALLQLVRASSQTTIKLVDPSRSALFTPGTQATVTGWGALTPGGGQYPDPLYQVSIPIISHETCNSPQSYNGSVTENMLCAGLSLGGKDSCQGDSGGPLMVRNPLDNSWMQVGIVSWGVGCAQPNFFGVYTKVSNFDCWTQSQIDPSLPGVFLFSEQDYQGRCSRLFNSQPDLSQVEVGDDTVSSVQIKGDYRLTLFEDIDFGGGSDEINHDESNLDSRPLGNKYSSARIEELDKFSLVINSVGKGTVSKDPDSPSYSAGTDVRLEAVPEPGWEFIGWSGDLSDTITNPFTITMDSNKTVTATFQSSPICDKPVTPPGATVGFCHQVQPTDTLYGLGAKYGVDPYLISHLNKLYSPHLIYDDQSLFIPAKNEIGTGPNVYIVKPGDTLTSIAEQCRLPISKLAKANELDPSARLNECKALIIPTSPYPPPVIGYPSPPCPRPILYRSRGCFCGR